MSRFGKFTFSFAAALSLSTGPQAAPDLSISQSQGSGYELLVVEAEGCAYCRAFRNDVVPAYRATPRAATVPLRFADIEALEAGSLKLTSPIETVPTVLLLKGGEEVGRLTGYLGRANFLQSLPHLLPGAD